MRTTDLRAAPAPQKELGAIPLGLEDDLAHARALNDLAYWINQSREYVEGIRHLARQDPAFAQALRDRQFPVNHAEWSDEAGCGLAHLHINIAEKLMSIRRFSGLPGAVR